MQQNNSTVLNGPVSLFKKHAALGVTQIGSGHTLLCCLSLTQMFNKMVLRVEFDEHKLGLSCSFSCDQNNCSQCYESSHTLLCCLRLTWMFHKMVLRVKFDENKLSCSFSCDQNNCSQCYESGHTLLCCLSLTQMFHKLDSEMSLMNKSQGLAAALAVSKIIEV